MLRLADEFDTQTRLDMLFNDWVAWDKDNQIYMVSSRGRRISGRSRRYYILREGWKNFPDRRWRIGFTARSDAEAIEKANAKLQGLGIGLGA